MSSDPQSSAKLVVRNIGLVLSGDLGQPIIDADTIVVTDGRISGIGKAGDVDSGSAANFRASSSAPTVLPDRACSHSASCGR